MSEPALAPRNAFHGVVAVWIVSFVTAILLGFLVPEAERVRWVLIAFGAIILLSFAVQLAYGRVQGFIVRTAGSVMGALALMGIVSIGFALAALGGA
ncbi:MULTISPECIES: hypothetical protein [Microbacterium]|uniref:hypothetical protein n=1 Tax=Microbacterium TaxID=33882 RepID=UPI00217E5114|nr:MULTISPECIES: hypothetical protein [Microbacterium]